MPRGTRREETHRPFRRRGISVVPVERRDRALPCVDTRSGQRAGIGVELEYAAGGLRPDQRDHRFGFDSDPEFVEPECVIRPNALLPGIDGIRRVHECGPDVVRPGRHAGDCRRDIRRAAHRRHRGCLLQVDDTGVRIEQPHAQPRGNLGNAEALPLNRYGNVGPNRQIGRETRHFHHEPRREVDGTVHVAVEALSPGIQVPLIPGTASCPVVLQHVRIVIRHARPEGRIRRAGGHILAHHIGEYDRVLLIRDAHVVPLHHGVHIGVRTQEPDCVRGPACRLDRLAQEDHAPIHKQIAEQVRSPVANMHDDVVPHARRRPVGGIIVRSVVGPTTRIGVHVKHAPAVDHAAIVRTTGEERVVFDRHILTRGIQTVTVDVRVAVRGGRNPCLQSAGHNTPLDARRRHQIPSRVVAVVEVILVLQGSLVLDSIGEGHRCGTRVVHRPHVPIAAGKGLIRDAQDLEALARDGNQRRRVVARRVEAVVPEPAIRRIPGIRIDGPIELAVARHESIRRQANQEIRHA